MNRQQFFDTAIAGIIAQGGPSIDDKGNCLYRAPDGCKCALGHLIADEDYDPDFEDKVPSTAASSHPLNLALGLTTFEDRNFAAALQGVHDCASKLPDFMPAFIAEAEDFAGRHELAWNHGNA